MTNLMLCEQLTFGPNPRSSVGFPWEITTSRVPFLSRKMTLLGTSVAQKGTHNQETPRI